MQIENWGRRVARILHCEGFGLLFIDLAESSVQGLSAACDIASLVEAETGPEIVFIP
jgi:hypothetical protein